MRVLVTGASGFIGGALARSLTESGHEVWGWSRRYPEHGVIPRDRYVLQDLTEPPADPLPPLDAMVHCAGLASPADGLADPVAALRTNALGTAHILEAARPSRTPVILASSVYVYDGTPELPWRENMPLRPRSPLGASKLAAEAMAAAYWSCFGTPSVALRLFTVFGPGARASSRQFIPSVFAKLERSRTGSEPIEFGPGDATRDFVYIDDIVAAFVRAIEFVRLRPGHHVFNVASGEERSIRRTVAEMLELLGSPPLRLEFDKLPVRPDESRGGSRHAASVQHSADVLGWRASVPFAEGLRRTYRWLTTTNP